MHDRRRYFSGLAVLGFVSALVAGACGGEQFSGDDGGNSGGSSGQGSGGTSSAGTNGSGGTSSGGGPQACAGPDECDDGDACTVDTCERGACRNDPLECAAGLTCCEGTCGECCADEDCADDVACSEDVCFLNVCAHLADDDRCAANEYCDTVGDCTERQACPNGTAEECDDQNPCTTDSCQAGLCYHAGCGDGLNCCEGEGCFACCGDPQCQNQDNDRCTDNTCVNHVCEPLPHCATGKCCATETGASCGLCCTADECDDEVACTHDSCGGAEGCKNVPDDSLCDPGEVCSLGLGCVSTSNCNDCVYPQVCCDGKCQECCTPEDCQVKIGTDSQAIPPPPGGECSVASCVEGTCFFGTQYCGFEEYCCPAYGCHAGGCPI
jgi:hypothetical protein